METKNIETPKMEETKLKYNELPVITFRWLKVNDLTLSEVKPGAGDHHKNYIKSGSDHVHPSTQLKIKDYLGDYKGTNETELNRILDKAPIRNYIVSAADNDLVYLKYELTSDAPDLSELNVIEVKAHETLNVLLEYAGADQPEFASVLNLIRVAPGGTLNLCKINQLPHSVRHIEQRYANVMAGGTVNYISIELGARETIINYLTDLAGAEAKGNLKSIYIGNEDRIIDLSHQMSHWGKKSTCDMELRGALTDKAKKYFRGTLDFKKGSAGSVGGEVETVMLLNKDVKSFAIPLLLCGEHDVIGNHAASAGQIDAEKLFYLMSRGFSKEQAKQIIVESAFRPIIDLLPDEALKERILARVTQLMKKVTTLES